MQIDHDEHKPKMDRAPGPWRIVFPLIACSFLTGCFGEDVATASADCNARAIEAKLGGSDKARHKNLCMKAHGFKRNTTCSENGMANQEAKECYSPGWQFWVREEMLAE